MASFKAALAEVLASPYATRVRTEMTERADRPQPLRGKPRSPASRWSLDLDGTGTAAISTGVGFYDHAHRPGQARAARSRGAQLGDVHIDAHHTVEDTAIVLGQAIRQALGDKAGTLPAFGDALVPLDEALARAVVDLSGRPFCVHTGEPDGQQYVMIGGDGSGLESGRSVAYVGSLTRHVLETLAFNAQICLHVRLLAGRDPHHIVECQFKALARALRAAVAFDPRVVGVPSTKGTL